ncbi:ATP-binding cassette domain-containing protein [Streptomyces sp. KR55]|uniref:ATP-binding cassette domain-containing protein n=1 Tax=Streptomyces sp. KR55 TaxID=3457425 RepID=UPI003FD00E81
MRQPGNGLSTAIRTCLASDALRAPSRLITAIGLYLGDWASFLTDAAHRSQLPAEPAPVPDRPAVIAARNIAFRSPGSELPVLENVSVTVRRGDVLAIVGANGAGKSTLAKLLAGLYTSTTGTVTWDDVDLATADPEQVWSRLALLPQDIARWQVRARENITLGQGDSSDRAVIDAARASGVDDVIARLPNGLDTNLAPSQWGGRDLAGGQWQRLAGARVFHRKDAPLLICDEPTSALDLRAEEAVYDRIRALSEGRTVVLITTASAPPAPPTGSSSSTAAASWRKARTSSSWPPTPSTLGCGVRRHGPTPINLKDETPDDPPVVARAPASIRPSGSVLGPNHAAQTLPGAHQIVLSGVCAGSRRTFDDHKAVSRQVDHLIGPPQPLT